MATTTAQTQMISLITDNTLITSLNEFNPILQNFKLFLKNNIINNDININGVLYNGWNIISQLNINKLDPNIWKNVYTIISNINSIDNDTDNFLLLSTKTAINNASSNSSNDLLNLSIIAWKLIIQLYFKSNNLNVFIDTNDIAILSNYDNILNFISYDNVGFTSNLINFSKDLANNININPDEYSLNTEGVFYNTWALVNLSKKLDYTGWQDLLDMANQTNIPFGNAKIIDAIADVANYNNSNYTQSIIYYIVIAWKLIIQLYFSDNNKKYYPNISVNTDNISILSSPDDIIKYISMNKAKNTKIIILQQS